MGLFCVCFCFWFGLVFTQDYFGILPQASTEYMYKDCHAVKMLTVPFNGSKSKK